jgi:hypothetical protein
MRIEIYTNGEQYPMVVDWREYLAMIRYREPFLRDSRVCIAGKAYIFSSSRLHHA